LGEFDNAVFSRWFFQPWRRIEGAIVAARSPRLRGADLTDRAIRPSSRGLISAHPGAEMKSSGEDFRFGGDENGKAVRELRCGCVTDSRWFD
jgi:hypothetical protein